ncbi:GntR family transcriptional regulator [Microbaculum marinisediminis]|uniref:GntR family transcriptional regulator n=1 Tax=Microbaculum marinisediminis TaxID=2931392 RepID=A0AAW5R070_9HYPH|nr:GntR family transcriptional regulator [Microbaculum sp. A6E488]MCT8973671.1 GntR family transcriptional regulator [Microbaculum sp. A6E488]
MTTASVSGQAKAPRKRLRASSAVDPESRVPLYHQIYVVLRNLIYSGQLGAGELVPGEQELAESFGVSRITAKRALNEMAAAGLVVRERGRGTRVVHRPPAPPVTASFEGWLENISLMGIATEARVLEFDYVAANEDVAGALKIATGDLVQRSVRVRSVDDETMSYLVTWLPEDIGRGFEREDLSRYALLTLLERAGIRVASARQTVSATVADPAVAAALGIDPGAPLLEVRRLVLDASDRPVEYIRVLYRPDRYRFEMNLERVHRAEGMRWTAQPTAAPEVVINNKQA